MDRDTRWSLRIGGISALVFGIAYVLIIAFYVPMGARPSGAEAWLANIARNTGAWWAIVGLSVLTDFLLVPIALSLYLALYRINRNAMLLATALVGLFVVLDLALTWINIATLIELSGRYAEASTEAQRAVFVAAAIYPSTVVESNLIFVYNSFTLAAGILISGVVMLIGGFSKLTAFLGLTAGILGIVAVTSSFFSSTVSGVTIILASIFTTVWAFFVGYSLIRLSR